MTLEPHAEDLIDWHGVARHLVRVAPLTLVKLWSQPVQGLPLRHHLGSRGIPLGAGMDICSQHETHVQSARRHKCGTERPTSTSDPCSKQRATQCQVQPASRRTCSKRDKYSQYRDKSTDSTETTTHGQRRIGDTSSNAVVEGKRKGQQRRHRGKRKWDTRSMDTRYRGGMTESAHDI